MQRRMNSLGRQLSHAYVSHGSPQAHEPPPSSPQPPQSQEYINALQYKILLSGCIDSVRREVSTNPSFRLSDVVCETNNNTALHIAASSGKKELVVHILANEPQLLHRQNSQGELPLHVAVRAGQEDVVRVLLQDENRTAAQLQAVNDEKNTALHIALENQHEELAGFLLAKCRLTFYQVNKRGMSPLYLAIKSGLWNLVNIMLDARLEDRPSVEDALRDARSSVIHAAMMARNQGIVNKIMLHYPDLRYSVDECGRTVLSYAAHIGFEDVVGNFLENLSEEAFQLDEDKSFPIHKACSGGHLEVVKKFLTKTPDTKWLSNGKGQSILHIAASSGKANVVKYLLGQDELKTLINMTDKDGNSPLHLATIGKHAKVVYILTWDQRVKLMLQNNKGFTPLDLAENSTDVLALEERLIWLALTYANAPRSPQRVHQGVMCSNESLSSHTASDNMLRETRDIPTKGKKYKDRLNTLLMVSTLTATMTFAAGFTVPGGYKSSNKKDNEVNEGTATLARHYAFQAFVLSNTIALYSSILAAITLIWAHLDDLKLSLTSLDFALPSLTIALTTMSVAFMTGLFVVLHGVCNWLAVVVSIIGCVFLLMALVIFIPLYFPSPYSTNKFARYIFRAAFLFMLFVCDRKGKKIH